MLVKIYIKNRFIDQRVCRAHEIDTVIDGMFKKHNEPSTEAHLFIQLPYQASSLFIPKPRKWILFDVMKITDTKRLV